MISPRVHASFLYIENCKCISNLTRHILSAILKKTHRPSIEVTKKGSAKMIYTPKISSDWKLLFKPEKYGNYVNDHSLIKDKDGHWHLFGITSLVSGADKERYFVHATAKKLYDDTPMEELGIVIDNGIRAWAPCVIEHENVYYMYYGPSPTKLDVSFELSHWMGHEIKMIGNPVLSTHRDHMIIRLEDGTYLMYVSGVKDGYSCISCHTSKDLITWHFSNYALTSSGNAPLNPPWGAFESPYVIKHKGMFYLFTTYTDCSFSTYQNMLVFCSKDPFSFGDYTKDNHDKMVITTLRSHAGEIICEDDGLYITSCGWRKYDIPIEGGVAIAKLTFE